MTRGLIKSLLAWNPAHFFCLVSERKAASTGETEDTQCTVSPVYVIWAPRCQAWEAQSNRPKPIATPHLPVTLTPSQPKRFPATTTGRTQPKFTASFSHPQTAYFSGGPFCSALSITMRCSPVGGEACFSSMPSERYGSDAVSGSTHLTPPHKLQQRGNVLGKHPEIICAWFNDLHTCTKTLQAASPQYHEPP